MDTLDVTGHAAAPKDAGGSCAQSVCLTIATTGLHPSSNRIVAVDAAIMDESGSIDGHEFFLINPGRDPGPRHLHGLTAQDLRSAPDFAHVMGKLSALINGRRLIVHDAPATWGYLRAESARAGKAPRPRRRRRRRWPAGPQPACIVDVLATARRAGVAIGDERIRGLARAVGVPGAPDPCASVSRAGLSAQCTLSESTRLVCATYAVLARLCEVSAVSPAALRADRFGYQRSHVRVDAAAAERRRANPGVFRRGGRLVPGMEIVLADDIVADPDDLIRRLVAADLAYSEKLTRATSLVVSNEVGPHFGKTFHAARKAIPIVSDERFCSLLACLEQQ